jgi:hypothetical protein
LDYVDFTLVRLATDSSRAALFDQAALEQLALAAYDAEAMAIGGPYTAVFDEVIVGMSIPRRGTIEAAWDLAAGGQRREGRVTMLGLTGDAGVRVDALWRGAVVARAASPLARIESAVTAWPTTAGIDEEIVAELGGLPGDPAVLEAERRARFLARVRAGMRQPEVMDDALFDAWLADVGARSVGDLIERLPNQVATGTIGVTFSAPPADPPAPRRLPIVVAVLVRDAPVQVAQLLTDSKLARDHLRELGVESAAPADAIARNPIVVAWMIPDTTFDDADWPGGDSGTPEERRAERRAEAGRWLAREGIGLVTTPAHEPT